MTKLSKKKKAMLKEMALKEGGKARWREDATLRRNATRIKSSQTIVDKKHKAEKYPHSYKYNY